MRFLIILFFIFGCSSERNEEFDCSSGDLKYFMKIKNDEVEITFTSKFAINGIAKYNKKIISENNGAIVLGTKVPRNSKHYTIDTFYLNSGKLKSEYVNTGKIDIFQCRKLN